jgi:hypothetical protein
MAFPEVMDRALSDGAVADLASRPLPPPPEGAEVELSLGPDGGVEGRFWRSGTYTLEGGRSVKVDLTPPVDLPGPWSVAFQEGRGAPASITLPALASLRLNADPGVRYFSGTATYSRPLDVPAGLLGDGRRVILDLGRVEVMARVRINGRDLGNLWKEPYQMDVTDAVHPGANDLEVAVTDLWPNRLIGDEQLPPENEYRAGPEHGVLVTPEWYAKGEPKPPGGRITFATWKFFNKDEPLLESGLLGPVRLLNPQDRKF